MFGKKWRRFISIMALLIVLLFILGMILPTILSPSADDLSALQSTYNSLEAEQKQIDQNINTNITKQASTKDQKLAIDKNVDIVNQQINILNTQILALNTQIEQKQNDVIANQKNIDDNTKLLEQRLCALYETGNISYISILLSSGSLTDFLSRIEILKTITDHDSKLIAQMKVDKQKVENDKKVIENNLSTVLVSKQNLSAKQSYYQGQKTAQVNLLKQLSDEQNSLNQKSNQIDENLQAKSEEIKQYILAHQSVSLVFNGNFQWPIHGAGYISCLFAGYYGHTGVDNACSTGTPVYAAASGRVMLAVNVAQNPGGYGTHLVIDHGVYKGNGYQTLYGHCSKLLVSAGEWVTQGQQIALSGSTGNSTGPHLHFEIRVNGTPINPYNFVKPY